MNYSLISGRLALPIKFNKSAKYVVLLSLTSISLISISMASMALFSSELMAQSSDSLGPGYSDPGYGQELVIDSVLASVDGVPITLKDIEARAKKFYANEERYKSINIDQIKSDPKLSTIADQMIGEALLSAEAEKRKIKVSDNDVERYIDQVAQQNNLSRQEFENALVQQGQNINVYAAQARIEVTRAKIMSQLAQSAPAVTEEELKTETEEESEASHEAAATGLRYKLREIYLPAGPELEQKVEKISEAISEGQDFSALATQYSVSSNASSGGDLGILAESDLSDQIKEAISELEPLSVSEPVNFEDGVRFFFLEAKYEDGESEEQDDSKKAMLRKELESRKLAKHFQQFFEVDIYKNHKIEKKF